MFDSDAMKVRTFAIPASAINPSGIVRVHFELPDARRPIDLAERAAKLAFSASAQRPSESFERNDVDLDAP
jgi:hypothetical protein